MREYLITFTVNNKRYQQTISASSPTDAERAILSQYSGQRVSIVNCKNLKMGYYCWKRGYYGQKEISKNNCIIVIVLIGYKVIFGGKYNTVESDTTRYQAQYDMASGFSKDEVDFEIVDAKDNEKFILKCKAKSENAKEMYKEIYGTDTVYYAYSDGYGSTYHYAIADTKSEAKAKIDW